MTRAVQSAYAARVEEYVEVCGTVASADPRDRDAIVGWASAIEGPILDVGCGPGQWTHLLRESGADVVGVDPVPEFVATAQQSYPGVRYRTGAAGDLEFPAGSFAGVLAWFSLIHTAPDDLDAVLDDLARVLVPQGDLLLGYFDGPRVEIFPHKVCPAWYWPADLLASRLDAAGFRVIDAQVRTDPGQRRQGAVRARLGGRPMSAGVAGVV